MVTNRKTRDELDRESLDRGSRRAPNSNDTVVMLTLESRGISTDDVHTFGPDQNVRTYRAWRALGRQVRKGEKSVRLTCWRPVGDETKIDPTTGKKQAVKCCPVTACVFHVSQTDAIGGAA